MKIPKKYEPFVSEIVTENDEDFKYEVWLITCCAFDGEEQTGYFATAKEVVDGLKGVKFLTEKEYTGLFGTDCLNEYREDAEKLLKMGYKYGYQHG